LSLPILKLRMIPEQRCTKCGAFGYVSDISHLCCWCLAPGLAIFHREKSLNLAERLHRNYREFFRLTAEAANEPHLSLLDRIGGFGKRWRVAEKIPAVEQPKDKDAS
jgi:hypothetical protein